MWAGGAAEHRTNEGGCCRCCSFACCAVLCVCVCVCVCVFACARERICARASVCVGIEYLFNVFILLH